MFCLVLGRNKGLRSGLLNRQSVALAQKLESEWNEVKDGGSPQAMQTTAATPSSPTRHFQQPLSGADGPMRVLSPMSEEDEAEQKEEEVDAEQSPSGAVAEPAEPDDVGKQPGSGKHPQQHDGTWARKMERAVVKLSAEVAALREQITTGREWRARKERSVPAWIGWLVWVVMKHLTVDFVVLAVVLFWMRRRKDRRLEDLVRAAVRLGREYARKVLPSR